MGEQQDRAIDVLAPAARSRGRPPPMELEVELRANPGGEVRHPELADHHINVHAGTPVGVACHSGVRSVRTRGDICLLPAGVPDVWVEDAASTSVELTLPSSLLRRVAGDLGLEPDRVGIELRYHFRDAQIEHIACALEADERAAFPNGLLYRESLGVALAVHLLGRYRTTVAPAKGLSRRQLRRVTDYIEDHLGQNLSLARLASVAEVSASHFKTLFKRSLGVPVHEYVVRQRVERARSLLTRGELSASQVALEAGFSHQSHMARWMRRLLGVTPTAVTRRA
jgi:AraC family transcriptional regulator